MIVRMCVLYLIFIIKSEVWTIGYYLWLGHETMMYAVCHVVHVMSLLDGKLYNTLEPFY